MINKDVFYVALSCLANFIKMICLQTFISLNSISCSESFESLTLRFCWQDVILHYIEFGG